MKQLICLVALGSLLATTGITWGRDLPWRTFQDAAKDLQGFSIASCQGEAVMVGYYRVKADAYIILTNDGSRSPSLILVVYDPNPDTNIPPTEYGVAIWTAGDAFPPLTWHPMGKDFDPCPLLYPTMVRPIHL